MPVRGGADAALLALAEAAHGPDRAVPDRIGLAVSGGSDSMAMLHLMARAAPRAGWALRAVTVDHRLRPEAADEAAFVGRICAGLGIPHEVLVWNHGDTPLSGNLMQAASRARYALMGAWAQRQGIGLVMLAHTADDQAETFLMGLSRAAGLDGLSGMRPEWQEAGVTFRRPFLGQGRAELRGWLVGKGLEWIDDPSNDNPHRARTRARRALKTLEPLGITAGRLAAVVHHLAMVQGVVQQAVATAAGFVSEAAGSLRFDHAPFCACDAEVRRRIILAMIGWIGGAAHPPREAKVAALLGALQARRDATLGGVRFRWRGEACTVSREARAAGGPVAPGQPWDGRWQVTGAAGEIRALGPAGLRQCPGWRATGLPRQVLEVTPAVWHDDVLIAAPCAGFGPATATCAPAFARFLLSH